jgi:hypothetical protein
VITIVDDNGQLILLERPNGTQVASVDVSVAKARTQGSRYVSGPGGLWILSPESHHLGTINLSNYPHNFA